MSEREGNVVKSASQVDPLIAAAHELKTPLTIISHLSAAVEAGDLGNDVADTQQALQRIRLSAESALRLVQGLTTSYRLEHTDQLAFRFELEPLNITQLCEEVAGSMLPLAAARSQVVAVESGIRPQSLVVGNTDLARSLLCNLVDNAIRHNQADTPVRLVLARRQGMVRICVRDHGPGIARSDFSTLRQNIGRQTQPLRGRSHGAGLGLYIAGHMATAMGGRLGMGIVKTGADFHVDLLPSKQLSFL